MKNSELASRLRLPVIASPMFLVSGVDLVLAQCRAGIVGSFPALNARPIEMFDEWLCRIEDGLAESAALKPAPYAVNLIVHRTNERLSADIETCARHKVPIVITSLMPPGDVVQAAHSYGGLVFHDITTVRHAEKAAEQGVDGLIVVCTGAGGHAGKLSPFALLHEVRKVFQGTIILAGSIVNGRGILAAQALGADYAYMGTRFIATREANAADGYKQMIVDSSAKDIIYTNAISGIHGNYLAPSLVNAGLDPENLPQREAKSYDSKTRSERPKAWKDIWGAGHGVGGIDSVLTVAECVAQLEKEYLDARSQLLGNISRAAE